MRRDHLAFLLGGLAFGVLFGYALFTALDDGPGGTAGPAAGGIPSPQGQAAPTQMGGGAPMVEEINTLKRRVQEDPGDTAALLRMGEIYGQVGMWSEAEAAFKLAVDNEPQNAALSRNLANLYHDAGRWENAVALYEHTLALEPGDPDLLTDLGICFRQMSQFERALAKFDEAHRADPSHWKSLFNTVVVAGLDLGRYDRADEALARLKTLKPDAPNLAGLVDALTRKREGGAPGGS